MEEVGAKVIGLKVVGVIEWDWFPAWADTPESKKGFTINGKGIVEIKTSMFPVGEEPPLHKGVLQVKGLMACTGYDWAVISILHGTDLKMYFYERDFSWEKKELEIAVTDFNKRVPLLDYYSPFDSREAARINPQDNGETTELSKEAQLHLSNIDTWKQQIIAAAMEA